MAALVFLFPLSSDFLTDVYVDAWCSNEAVSTRSASVLINALLQ